jgi:hypothetical protein
MRLSGIEEAKTAIMNECFRISVSKEQGKSPGLCFNARFDGNPGCGKTTVARIYAKMLQECDVVPKTALFFETSGRAHTYTSKHATATVMTGFFCFCFCFVCCKKTRCGAHVRGPG